MNREELKVRLEEDGIPESWYSLDGEALPNRSVLQKGGGKKGYWVIYGIDERGHKSGFREFIYENEACESFYRMLKEFKDRQERLKNMPPYFPPPQEEKRTFIVSETGESIVKKENDSLKVKSSSKMEIADD